MTIGTQRPPPLSFLPSLLLALVATPLAPPAAAQERDGRLTLGGRLDVLAADGEPANDIPTAGVYLRYRLADRWSVGVAVDHSPKFDVERPYEFLGLQGAEEVDADGVMTSVTSWIERDHPRPAGRLSWFWTVGAGFATVDVDDVAGRLAGGGRYDITEDVGTELLAGGSVGLRWRFGEAWEIEGALRADRHFTDWTVTDRVSGRTTELDDYLVHGVNLGLAYRF